MRKSAYLRSRDSEVILGNANMEIRLSRETGNISRLIHQRKKLLWNSHPGRLEICDGLTGKCFRTGESLAKTFIRISRGRQPSLNITRRFRGADFLVRETFRPEADCIHWEVELLLDAGKPERSIEIRQLVPWPTRPWGWRIWSANFNFPTYTHNVAELHLEYGDVCYGTLIPAFTVYHPAKDVGLSVAKPFGLPTPRLRFHFMDYSSEGVDVENDLLGLRRGKKVKVALMLRFQEGCFRPTLAWLLRKYPDYFLPGNPGVRKLEGGSTFGPPHVNDRDAKRLAKAGVVWYEIHHSFPCYGEYCPEVPEWRDGSSSERIGQGKPISTKVINDCGKTLAKQGIASLLYMQVTGDAWLPVMRKKFPESLARDMDGNLFSTFVNGAFINSDPSLPFGKDMQRQIRGVLERYPSISGIFLDQACYNATDCAHDDGLTMYRNKPAYRLRFNYDKHLPGLVRALHERGKFIYSNGPYDIELQRGFDGNMAESTATDAISMKYMHIAKPLLFFAYYKDEADLEDMLQQCLLAGASWSVWVPTSDAWFIRKGPTPVQKRLFERYVPLCRRLLGRRILLEPNPVVFPKRAGVFAGEGGEVTIGEDQSRFVDWEIFRGEDGNILVSLVTRRKSCLDKSNLSRNLRLIVRTKEAKKIRRVYAIGADYKGTKPVSVTRKGNQLHLNVPLHGAASLIILETRKRKK